MKHLPAILALAILLTVGLACGDGSGGETTSGKQQCDERQRFFDGGGNGRRNYVQKRGGRNGDGL